MALLFHDTETPKRQTIEVNPWPHYVVIEGCIGVGKTTLTQLLGRRFRAQQSLEVVEENPFLPSFYEDQVANAFKTQLFFLLSRFKQQETLAQIDLFKNNLVADYLFEKDRLFAELTLSAQELELYDEVFQRLKERVVRPDVVVFLNASMDTIMGRIMKRGREFEKDISRSYLEGLVNSYRSFFASYTDAPVLIVDTDELNFPKSKQDMDWIIEQVQKKASTALATSV